MGQSLNEFIEKQAKSDGCSRVGFLQFDGSLKMDFPDPSIIPGNFNGTLVILEMALDDPVKDAWTLSATWPRGKNYIDESLANVAASICLKLERKGYQSRPLKYSGAYLKHLAVHAGLGTIGRNNLLITPEFGPRIRMRAFTTLAPLTPGKSIADRFQPCNDCPVPPPCVKACPAGAFTDMMEEKRTSSRARAPRSGYSRPTCRGYCLAHLKPLSESSHLWCRACEDACVVGKDVFKEKKMKGEEWPEWNGMDDTTS